eukprot:CFRG4969T1
MTSNENNIQELQTEVKRLRKALQVKGVNCPTPPENVSTEEFKFDTIPDALEAIKRGEFVVVLDNEDRENEGDLIAAAELMTTEQMAFMIRHTSGVICLSVTEVDRERLQLPLMVERNTEKHGTAFTHTIDYSVGTSTGISAADRSATVIASCDPKIAPSAFNRPGHIFPLVSHPEGVLGRMGHTEATSDLCKLAGLKPMGILSEIALEDGSMARRSHLEAYSKVYGLKMITISDLIEYRKSMNL